MIIYKLLLLLLQGSWGKRDTSGGEWEENEPQMMATDELESLMNNVAVKRAWDNLKGPWGKRASGDWASLKGKFA